MLTVVVSRQYNAHNRIPAAEVRHDARGDPAFGGWDGGSRSERGGDGSTGTDWSRTGGPVAFRSRAAQLALANQDGGAVEEEVGRDPQSRRRAAGTGRNQAFGGGKRFVRVSGWALLELIGRGVTDVEVLAGKARGVRKQDRELQEALAGPLGAGLPALAAAAHGCRETSRRCILDVRALLDSELPGPA